MRHKIFGIVALCMVSLVSAAVAADHVEEGKEPLECRWLEGDFEGTKDIWMRCLEKGIVDTEFGNCPLQRANFGGPGGTPFGPVKPSKLSTRSGEYVDALIINGDRYGGKGGYPLGGTLELKSREYISRMVIWHGEYVYRLEVETFLPGVYSIKTGAPYTGSWSSFRAGGKGRRLLRKSTRKSTLSNIRVFGIAGRAGEYLDQIEVIYCAEPNARSRFTWGD